MNGYGINVVLNNIRNPGFSIVNKTIMGQTVKLSLQFRENNITMHMLFYIKLLNTNITTYLFT
jgi:hypothetical protein